MRKLLVTALILLMSVLQSMAQSAETVEMADALRSSGKIYVVVVVLSIIFTGIIMYLVLLDRKIGRIEKGRTDH